MTSILLQNIRLLNPEQKLDRRADVLIVGGKIAGIGENLDAPEGVDTRDGSSWVAAPGFYDMHIHLREPGATHKETIETGCASAANGGFTGLACMPNTSPAIDSAEVVHSILWKSQNLPVDVNVVGATTVGRKGETLAPMGELYEAGVRMFSDDGDCVRSPEMMRRAFEYASQFEEAVLSQHCEEHTMTVGFAMNEGAVATRLGMPGYPDIAEELIIERDIRLAEFCGDRPYHVSHMSTAGGVESVRSAKARGKTNITCEVTPHHFLLTDEAIEKYWSNAKMNPPLRTEEHRHALLDGFRDGTIDAIATDHAPHALSEKEIEFPNAPNGIIGLETSLGLSYTYLVDAGVVSLERLIELMAINPRKILSLPIPFIEEGADTNLTIFAPEETWRVDTTKFLTKSRNTPFNGWELKGKPIGVVNRGDVVWSGL
ncbi:MAG: dihydroorotase [Chlorobi bacterium]|nr:dihydroorotase [Chlorobiota bacterium]